MGTLFVIAVFVAAMIACVPFLRRRSKGRPAEEPEGSAQASPHEPAAAPDPPAEGSARHFHLAVHGESFENPDGTSRQEIIRHCAVGEAVMLVPEPTNQFDRLAVKVCRRSGEQIGYLPMGHGLSTAIKAGRVTAVIDAVRGGEGKKQSRGVVLRVARIMD